MNDAHSAAQPAAAVVRVGAFPGGPAGRAFLLAAGLALADGDAAAQYVERSPSPQFIARTAARFKAVYSQTGMIGLAGEIQGCYDRNARDNRELIGCMLLDVAAIKLDAGMREQFVSRGMPDVGTMPYFSAAAIRARMNIYVGILFGGNMNAALSYMSGAADQVLARSLAR